MTDFAIKRFAQRLLLPLLLINVTVANQGWTLGPLMISQFLFFWPAIACAFLIVLLRFGTGHWWPWLLFVGLIVGRGLGANDAATRVYLIYVIPLHALFLTAGAIVAVEDRRLLYRQLLLYFVLTVPFMFLQVAGAGDWTLALNTETTAVGDGSLEAARHTERLLFVRDPDLVSLTVGQSRPAGLLHANNVLSLVIMFALAVQFGRIRSPYLTWSDVLFASAMVLAMAKIVMLSFALMAGWLLVAGTRTIRMRVRRVLAMAAVLYGVYAVLFPGLFNHHFDVFHITYSVYIRLNDLVATLGPDHPLSRLLAPILAGTPRLEMGGESAALSGYAAVAGLLPILLLAGFLGWRIVRRALRRMPPAVRRDSTTALLVLFVAVLFPAAVPYWGSPLYWFVVGVGLMPLAWSYSARADSSLMYTGSMPAEATHG